MPTTDPPQNDIPRQELADRLRLSEQRFREIVDQNPYAVHMIDTQGHTLHVNNAFRRLFGEAPPPGYSVFEDPMLIAAGQRDALIARCRGEERQAPEFWADPSKSDPRVPIRRFCVRLNAFPLRNPDGEIEAYVIMLEDITARKLAEEALRESEAKNRAFVEAIPDLIFFSTVDGICLDYHSSHAEALLVAPEEFLGKNIIEFMPPEVAQRCHEAFRQADLTHSVQVVDYSLPMGGKSVDFESRVVSCLPGSVLSLVRDVTERNRAEKALRESEQRFRGFFMNTSDGILWLSVQGAEDYRIEDLNPAAQAHFRISASSAKGKALGEILPPEGAAKFMKGFEDCLQSGRPRTFTASLTLPDGRKDFTTLAVPVLRGEGRYDMVAIARDITQTLQAEQAMRQAQKLESLGVLAGGIAHDFNNLLTAILGNLNLAQLHLSPASPALPYIDSVEKTILRAAELTKQMLAYSGRGRFVVKPHDLNHVVQEMAHLLHVSISKKISLQIHPTIPLPPIEADAAQLQQVVMNLVTNASDAIGDQEGTIQITTGTQVMDEAFILAQLHGQGLSPGRYVTLEVSDTGCGMTQEVISRIFDPFFTTKTVGRGLGLSALQGIIRGHHAGFRIYSEVGKGTVFRLFFPAIETPVVHPEPPQNLPDSRAGGLILLVDDEPSIRETTSTMLEAMGFEVMMANDGRAAVDLFQHHADRVRLVLLDLTMPRMDGREAFQAIRSLNANTPVILSSGYTEQESSKDFINQSLLTFLQKPYTFRELKAAIQKSLE
ncbi:PAS domain-containing hybrid sensor histidine kinase/response regulator [Holophaga foetida]|uniref:PAS domain-containing hybrid sensor histidine kinase/response regulator n=1 Tax=Holophaga foetida TaxID=35839 RepID=UPI00024717CC|nr:PAS domain-containing sensor histidine kinase [Holophaga foetida]